MASNTAENGSLSPGFDTERVTVTGATATMTAAKRAAKTATKTATRTPAKPATKTATKTVATIGTKTGA